MRRRSNKIIFYKKYYGKRQRRTQGKKEAKEGSKEIIKPKKIPSHLRVAGDFYVAHALCLLFCKIVV
ncbi:MAG: hypothetical protein A2747_01390 [Candidatus Yonathbacteria bacterium RIFCSPHIGHO2_01_FULL_44_41]|uniref:Uncharacterized protein n=1 Tax=Candidatus Yonathbacteria bacterium RIFCSPHIGHO2_02_FULL_44_14 TaxID=1802724 RepID=A0A1G2S8C8_9BACT|nr:MAG: hypothetical protein A2747_01390 [Candidatus Yonathbacteria bacterium RIFCSPHIGHO2_01_FULL_44_41]OHA80958.1 MAG: hypothetical protein A3D51_02970 [Candidatus Yonathbacteria bacterium RIFCSPHIGHO2_02_FULL_44_14]OHA82391.1 MAG: hypothetical protein A3B06_00610 [Candidatus Yonathbacteria bacterium RIFCSPLOWO2_01_FULL_43_20]